MPRAVASLRARSRHPFTMDLDLLALPAGMTVALAVTTWVTLHRTGRRSLLTALLIVSAAARTIVPIHDLLPRGLISGRGTFTAQAPLSPVRTTEECPRQGDSWRHRPP